MTAISQYSLDHHRSTPQQSKIQQSEWDGPFAVMTRIAQGPKSLERGDMSVKTAYTRLAKAAALEEVQAEIRRMGTTAEGEAVLMHWSQAWVAQGYVPPWEVGSHLTVDEIGQMLDKRAQDLRDPFDLETAQLNEIQRWLKLLGSCIEEPYDYDQARQRADMVGVRFHIFHQKLMAYHKNGEVGLCPVHWLPLDKTTQARVLEKYLELGELADAEYVTESQIELRAFALGWRPRRVKIWVQRYREGGLWKLVPSGNPEKGRRKKRSERCPRAYGALTSVALETMFARLQQLGSLIEGVVHDPDVIAQSEKVGKSPRTLWYWLGLYREFGLIGLAPLERADKGKRRDITDEMVLYIEGVRISQPDRPDHEVYEIACREARRRGEVEPTPWQVRSIVDGIRTQDKLIADGRERQFHNRFRFTGPINWAGAEKVVWQIDHTPVDVLVKDCRREQNRRKSGETRLYLTACKDAKSGIVLAARFTYDRPDRHVIAAVIRDAILITASKPYGGIPDEIWVDRGKEMISKLVRDLCAALKIKLFDTRRPELKGKVERLFRTLNTLLWSKQPGYVNSNVVLRNPNATAELLPEELIERFCDFIERYNNHVDKKTKLSRLEYWYQNCFTLEAEPRLLDMLLMDAKKCKMGKVFFSFQGGRYTEPSLSLLTGEPLIVRGTPYVNAPPEVEVFYDGEWVCTAFKMNEDEGKLLRPDQLKDAQQAQRRAISERNRDRRAAVKAGEHESPANNEVKPSSKDKKPKQRPLKPSNTNLSRSSTDLLKYETGVGVPA